jgi:hypothetical protein
VKHLIFGFSLLTLSIFVLNIGMLLIVITNEMPSGTIVKVTLLLFFVLLINIYSLWSRDA